MPLPITPPPTPTRHHRFLWLAVATGIIVALFISTNFFSFNLSKTSTTVVPISPELQVPLGTVIEPTHPFFAELVPLLQTVTTTPPTGQTEEQRQEQVLNFLRSTATSALRFF